MEFEKRGYSESVEVRENDDGTVTVQGYATVFDQETDIAGIFREVIRPGAFRNAIERGDDVAFLINHGGLPLARSTSRTLALSEDTRGLRISTTLDATDPDVRRIVPKMKRGDLSKMSFAFSMEGGAQRWASSGDVELREILEVGSLSDVSIVTYPAYEGTSIAMRSREAAKEKTEEEQREAEKARIAYAVRKAEQEQKFRKI